MEAFPHENSPMDPKLHSNQIFVDSLRHDEDDAPSDHLPRARNRHIPSVRYLLAVNCALEELPQSPISEEEAHDALHTPRYCEKV